MSGPGRAPAGWPGPGRLAVGLSILVGVVLRAIVLLTALGRPDSDEVITGLMARHLYPAYFWGQHYGGTLELLPVAASLRLFGMSVPGLRVPTVVLAAVNAVLVWRCARRMMGPGQAQVAGLLAWVWPAAAVWFGVREQLFYVPTLTLGLAALLLALRLADGPPRWNRWEWAGLGLALGLGWWTSPNIIYFLLPVAAVVFLPRSGEHRMAAVGGGLAVALGAAVVGALPWLITNVGSGLRSLHDSDAFPRPGATSIACGGSSPTGSRRRWASDRWAPWRGSGERSGWSPTSAPVRPCSWG